MRGVLMVVIVAHALRSASGQEGLPQKTVAALKEASAISPWSRSTCISTKETFT